MSNSNSGPSIGTSCGLAEGRQATCCGEIPHRHGETERREL